MTPSWILAREWPLFAAELLLKSILLLAAVLLLAWFLRRRPAAERHLVLAAGAGALLLLPLASLSGRGWGGGLVPEPFAPARSLDGATVGRGAAAEVAGLAQAEASEGASFGTAAGGMAGGLEPDLTTELRRTAHPEAVVRVTPPAASLASRTTPRGPRDAAPSARDSAGMNAPRAVVRAGIVLWVLGAGVFLFRLAAGCVYFRRILRGALPVARGRWRTTSTRRGRGSAWRDRSG